MSDTPETKAAEPSSEPKGEVVKDLDYYIAHPGEIPDDVETLEALVKGDAPASAEPAEGGEKETKADAPAGQPEKIDGVLTKDGKHVIPYEEMQRRLDQHEERTQAEAAGRQAAEQFARDMQTQVEALQNQLRELTGGKPAGGGEGGGGGDGEPSAEPYDKELMEALRQEHPEFAKLFDAQAKAIDMLTGQVGELTERLGQREKTDAQVASDEVVDLLQEVPELDRWRQEVPWAFARAQQVEDALYKGELAVPKDEGKTLDELKKDDVARYGVVLRIVQREFGMPVSEPPKKEAEATRAAENAETKVVEKRPTTLSDVPGGSPPPNSEFESLEKIPAATLGARMLAMTPAQRDEYLRTQIR